MAIYYIDNHNGDNALDGLSPENSRKDYADIELVDGDTVLFKRGSFYRDKLYAKRFISYGAYGEGDKPTFCGSFDVSLPEDWVETEKENVWKCVRETLGDVGNMVFNEDECTATFRWSPDELCAQGDFYDERCVVGDKSAKKASSLGLYLYSKGNPAEFYSHIEAISYNKRQLVDLREGMSFDSLRFINSGVHAMAGSGNHITVKDCVIESIGGCAWNKELKIRFATALRSGRRATIF